MMGYMKDPHKTAETIDEHGWLHSGDVGRVDEKTKLLYITGRIKELLITAVRSAHAPPGTPSRL
jgi:long-subunit acyl-CoA synthetase (AMP-forming)